MSIVEEILKELSSGRTIRYKGVSTNLFGIPKFKDYSKRSLRSSVDRLVKNEMIQKELNGFILTANGRKYLKKKEDSLKSFFKIDKNLDKNLLVMFDIPNIKKAEREWFRFHLKKFGFILIQKSVWVGPAPLPKDFLEYLKEIKLEKCIKTFKLAKSYKK
ncbi:MAG: CRISPR-associated endonuclease Cas2 [Candidatus Paceibacterota bacterium]